MICDDRRRFLIWLKYCIAIEKYVLYEIFLVAQEEEDAGKEKQIIETR
jgi:hypothetical protein